MGPEAYLEHLRSDGEALAKAARSAPTAAVPSCPEWDMAALVAHVGGVHEWVDQILRTRAQVYRASATEAPTGFEAAMAWYDDGLASLLASLAAIDPDDPVWNWWDRQPAPARFWSRRMAHETAAHRWDAENAAGSPEPIATDLAVDGIDEYLSFVSRWLAREPVAGLEGSLHLHATDADGEWSLQVRPDGLELRREHSKADAALRGPVSDLLLWMLNRLPADSPRLQHFGDDAIIASWSQLQF